MEILSRAGRYIHCSIILSFRGSISRILILCCGIDSEVWDLGYLLRTHERPCLDSREEEGVVR